MFGLFVAAGEMFAAAGAWEAALREALGSTADILPVALIQYIFKTFDFRFRSPSLK